LAKESLRGVGDKALLFPKSSAGRLGGVLFRIVAREAWRVLFRTVARGALARKPYCFLRVARVLF
jgi:hypothetical protein